MPSGRLSPAGRARGRARRLHGHDRDGPGDRERGQGRQHGGLGSVAPAQVSRHLGRSSPGRVPAKRCSQLRGPDCLVQRHRARLRLRLAIAVLVLAPVVRSTRVVSTDRRRLVELSSPLAARPPGPRARPPGRQALRRARSQWPGDPSRRPGRSARRSAALMERARRVTPGGVNSPVRAFTAVGGTPRFMASASGARLTDVDGQEYVDLVGSWGPMLLGHAHPEVLAAVSAAVGARDVVRHPHRARGRAGRGDRRADARRAGPARLVRHRGDDVGDPARAGLHRPRHGREVRRLLPRARRHAAGRGGLGPGDARRAGHPRRPGVGHGPDRRAALQRPRGRRGGVRRARRSHRLPDHRGGAGQHGRRPARAGLQRVPGRDLPTPRRALRLRRGDDRLPRLPPGLLGARRRHRGLGARPDDLRQGHGRRLPGRGVRRPRPT